MKKGIFLPGLFIVAAMFFSGCNDELMKDASGRIVVNVTDGPFNINYIESATVTITSIEIRKAGVSDTVPFLTIMKDPVTVDLMKLRNGVMQQLVNLEIPAGSYNQVRLITGEASLKIKEGGLFTLKIPSGSQTGIKIFISPSVVVEGGLTSDILLDFDLSNSFILKGNLNKPSGVNGFNFKPTVRAVNLSTAGTVEGSVSDITIKILEGASVWVKKDTVIAKAFTDAQGKYAIPGIPAGTYTVGAHKENYDTLLFAGVKVISANRTTRNFALKPE